MNRFILTLCIAGSAFRLAAVPAIIADMEQSIRLPGMNFWADGPLPGFELLSGSECASGNCAMKVNFFPARTYCNFGFSESALPPECVGIAFKYKNVSGNPPSILELRSQKDGKTVDSFIHGLTWQPGSEYREMVIPLADFKLQLKRDSGKLTAGNKYLVLFNFNGKKTASVTLDDVCWVLADGRKKPICDFEQYHADTWVPDGLWLWADDSSSNPVASLLQGTEAAAGNVSLKFRFFGCRYFQGITFFRSIQVPPDGNALSFQYKLFDGKFPRQIQLLRLIGDNMKNRVVYLYDGFTPKPLGKWETVVIPFAKFSKIRVEGNAEPEYDDIRPGDRIYLIYQGEQNDVGTFALDEIKIIAEQQYSR